MSATAVVFLALAMIIIWGGLIASIVFLVRRSEVASYPADRPATDADTLS